MNLPVQDFGTMVKTQTAAVGASCRQLVDTTVGSVLRALLEANASVGLWIQWLILQVLATTRAATSDGADLDSWVGDFGLARLPASFATGQVRFSRAVAGLSTVVPAGALVRTGTSATDRSFAVVADTTHPAWTGTGYAVAATDLSVTVPVTDTLPGSAGDVRAGAVVQLATAIPGIDAVVNDAAFSGGLDAETDVALRQRFSAFLDSRTRATQQAVAFAIASVQQGLSYTIAERVDSSGAVRAGHFTVTVDDGSGAPSSALIAAVAGAVDKVRPIGGSFSVRPPLVIPVDVAMAAVGPLPAVAAAQAAVSAYIGSLPIGASLIGSKLIQVAHDAAPGLTSISAVTINGQPGQFVPPIFGLVRPHTVVVG